MNERIANLILGYGRLNRIYTDILSGGDLSFEMQKYITEFYHQNEDPQAFEGSLIRLMLTTDKSHFPILLDSLRHEIEANISTYHSNQAAFDNFDIEAVCCRHSDHFNLVIDRQLEATRACNKKRTEMGGALEALGFKEHGEWEEALLDREYNRCSEEYEQEKAELNALYNLREMARQEAMVCMNNRFNDIYKLGNSLLFVLEKYKADEREERDTDAETTPMNTSTCFSMKLLSAIHEVCNGEQFEGIPETDFYAAMNLQLCSDKLKIRSGEKSRVCYLIFLMSEILSKQDRETWKDEILKRLDISRSYYRSKYKEPVSDFPSDKNRQFAEEIKRVFR